MAVTIGTGPSVPRSRMAHPNNLRKLRIAAGILKQATVAQRVDVTPWNYVMMERGHRPIPDSVKTALAAVLDATPEQIIGPPAKAKAPTKAKTKAKARAAQPDKPTPGTPSKAPRLHPKPKPYSNGHDTLALAYAPGVPPAVPATTPPIILMFAAAAALPAYKWPMAIRVLQALKGEEDA